MSFGWNAPHVTLTGVRLLPFLVCACVTWACGSSAEDPRASSGGHSSSGGHAGTPSTGAAGMASSGAGQAANQAGTAGEMQNGDAGAGGALSAAGQGGAAPGGAATTGGVAGSTGGVGGSALATPFKGVANSACEDLPRLGASWWYNWVLSPGSCKAGEFVPMIAGKAEKTPAAVQSALGKLKAAGYRTLLGFNEPNKTDQANLTVAQVLELWPALTADAEVRVGSPATSADGKAWFEDFMTQAKAKALRVDFVAIHWYGWNAGSCNDAKELESYIAWAEKFELPIWITEFGCLNESNPSPAVVEHFYSSAVEMLAHHPRVERYAWYPWTKNNELVAAGSLTALGATFAKAAASR